MLLKPLVNSPTLQIKKPVNLNLKLSRQKASAYPLFHPFSSHIPTVYAGEKSVRPSYHKKPAIARRFYLLA